MSVCVVMEGGEGEGSFVCVCVFVRGMWDSVCVFGGRGVAKGQRLSIARFLALCFLTKLGHLCVCMCIYINLCVGGHLCGWGGGEVGQKGGDCQ